MTAVGLALAGLRLLVSTPEVHVLLPPDWRKGEGSAFLVAPPP